MDEENPDKGPSTRPNLRGVVLDWDDIVQPFLEGARTATKWASEVGLPVVAAPETLIPDYSEDLDDLPNQTLGTLLNKLSSSKAYLIRILSETRNEVRDQKAALVSLKRTLRRQYEGSEKTKLDYVESHPNVIDRSHELNKAEDRLELVEGTIKSIDIKYKSLSRVVTLRTDENEQFRRVDYVDNIRTNRSTEANSEPGQKLRRADRMTLSVQKRLQQEREDAD